MSNTWGFHGIYPPKTTHLGGFHWGFYEYSILLRALAVSWGKQRKDPKHLGMATAHLCLPPKIYKPMYGRFRGENDDRFTMLNGIFVVFPNIFRYAIGFWWYFPAFTKNFREQPSRKAHGHTFERRMVRRLVRMAWPSNMPAKSCKRMRSC